MPLINKRKGSALMVVVIVSAMIISILGLAMARMYAADFRAMSYSSHAYQAQFYALSEGDYYKKLGYDSTKEVAAGTSDSTIYTLNSSGQNVASGFTKTVHIVSDVTSGNAHIKTAVIKIFYNGTTESLASATIKVTK